MNVGLYYHFPHSYFPSAELPLLEVALQLLALHLPPVTPLMAGVYGQRPVLLLGISTTEFPGTRRYYGCMVNVGEDRESLGMPPANAARGSHTTHQQHQPTNCVQFQRWHSMDVYPRRVRS